MSAPSPGDLIRNAVFVVAVPGVVGGLIPWLITRYQGADWGRWYALVGAVSCALIASSVAVLLYGVWRFATDGRGTPSPTAPTQRLVIAGPYRYVRNPMYLAVGGAIAGQALLFASAAVAAYLAAFAAAVALFVRLYEEPTLARTHGDEYVQYCARVPRWWPRVTRS